MSRVGDHARELHDDALTWAPRPGMRSAHEIRAEIARIDAASRGSYEELAGAASALRWVLGEQDYAV